MVKNKKYVAVVEITSINLYPFHCLEDAKVFKKIMKEENNNIQILSQDEFKESYGRFYGD